MQSILKYTRAALIALILGFGLVTLTAHAAPTGGFEGGLTAVGNSGNFTQDAIAADQGIVGAIADIISILLAIAGAVAVLAIIYGGFLYLTSAGNEGQAKSGQQVVTYAIIGTIIIILSYVIIQVIVSELISGA